jgi:4-amino-4-deoxy-L-arabinose transferase-like glycosyltransferase
MPSEPDPTPPRWRDALLTSLLCLPFSLSSIALPWGRDQGIYGQAAGRMLDGFVPYSETFVFKPPGTLVVHALSILAFGRGMVAIRLLDVGWTLATALLIAAIARRATGDRTAGVVAGVAYAVLYHFQSYWMSAQTDGWANLPMALAVLLLVSDATPRGHLVRGLLAGVLAGAAFWLKYTTGGVLPVLLLVPILLRGRAGLDAAGAVLGGFIVAVLGVLVALGAAGGLDAFLSIQRDVVLPYSGATGDGLDRRDMFRFFWPLGRFTPPGLILGALGLIVAVARPIRARVLDRRAVAGLAAVGWVLAGLLSAFVQGKFWTYQYLLVLGGLAILIAVATSAIGGWVGRRWALAGVVASMIGISCFSYPARWAALGGVVAGQKTLDQAWLDGKFGGRGFGYDDIIGVSSWLREHSDPQAPIFVWGYDPMIYVLAEREMATRFPYTYPMVIGWGPHDAYRAEFMASIRETPPSTFVVGSRDGVRLVTGHRKDSWRTFKEFDELREYLERHYVEQPKVGRFRVFSRRE